MEARTEVFKKLEQLATILTSTSEPKNKCWWDTEPCPFYSEVKGFQDATLRCRRCSRVDEERFFSIFQEVAGEYFLRGIELGDIPAYQEALNESVKKATEEVKEAAKEEGREEGINEAYQEFCEHVDGLLEKLRKSRKK